MARGSHQKLKHLYLAKILREETDDSHALTLPEIIKRLNSYGSDADRKCLYDDLYQLDQYGMEIIQEKVGQRTYYHCTDREFELAELRMIIDAICSSKFITAKKSKDLIGKLEKMVSIIHAPTADKPWNKVYTIRFLGNVADGRKIRHLNLELDSFKAAIIRQLQDGKVVWFGSDVGKFGERQQGIWDDQLFNLELVTGLDLKISKEDRSFLWKRHRLVIEN